MGPFSGVLEYVAGRLISSGQAVLRGDVLRLPMPLTPGGSMTALYAAIPVYFDEAFASVVLENGSDAAIVWLVPIGNREAEFVEEEGWEAFEQELVRQDPDLLDLSRSEMALPSSRAARIRHARWAIARFAPIIGAGHGIPREGRRVPLGAELGIALTTEAATPQGSRPPSSGRGGRRVRRS